MTPTSYHRGQPLRLSGSGPHLLLDDALVEDRMFLKRVLYRPAPYEHNPILVRDQPWEGDSVQAPLVIHDPARQQYRMWYTCANTSDYYGGGVPYYLAYAESPDGFNWVKPVLDLCPWGQYQNTNILYLGAHENPATRSRMFVPGQIWLDEAGEPSARYKMVGLDGRPDPAHHGEVNTEPNLLGSPDGLRWQLLGSSSMLDLHSDCANQLHYDAEGGQWLLFCRPPMYSSGLSDLEHYRHYRRRVAVMTSEDLEHWNYPRTVLYADEDEHNLPDIDHITVFRQGSHFLMLYAAMDGDGDGLWHTRLASSTDGLHWARQLREDFFPPGPAGSWDAGILPCGAPVPSGDKLLLYYSGSSVGQHEMFSCHREPRGGGGVAVMTRDRFVAQRAGSRSGYLLTREFLLEGNTLLLNMNVDTAPFQRGQIRVEVCRHPPLGQHAAFYYHEGGYSYHFPGYGLSDCEPLRGDNVRAEVSWAGKNLERLKGQAVYLRFELTSADLFSFNVQ